MLTLSFIWRPIYLNFLDEKYTRRLFFLTLPYCIFILTFSSIDNVKVGFYPEAKIINSENRVILKNSYNWQFYDEELENYGKMIKIPYFTIPSKRVSSSIFEVFIRMYSYDDELIAEADSTLMPFRKTGTSFSSSTFNYSRTEKDLHKIKSTLQKNMTIKIDSVTVNNKIIDCDFYTHPHNDLEGLLCYFPIDSLKKGRHYLTVEKDNKVIELKDTVIRMSYTIPFIYEN